LGRSVINEIDNQYGRLTILQQVGYKHKAAMWLCHCTCGNEVIIRGSSLRDGSTKSCGCLRNERTKAYNKTRKLSNKVATLNRLITILKHSAKQRDYVWSLTADQVEELSSQPCYYCGAAPSLRSSSVYNGLCSFNGLDRVDNERGYEIDNVVPCCSTCNKAKNTMTQDEFLMWISWVYKHSMLKEKDETLP